MTSLVFGTAGLGMAYGLPRAGQTRAVMSETEGATLIEAAVRLGIDVFDTAPAYGVAEDRLGRVLGERGQVWTKLGRHEKISATLTEDTLASLEASLTRLRRPVIDVLQWHNWTADLIESSHFRACWARLGADRRVRRLGASTYGTADALAAVESGLFQVVQVEWNILNQGVVEAIDPVARPRGISIAVRSVFLQGALTGEPRDLPPVPALVARVKRAERCAREAGLSLRDLALRSALSQDGVSYVLMGFDRVNQLEETIRVAENARLDAATLRAVRDLSEAWDPVLDPRTWPATAS
jgi:1-deoxyxylulose-5-phosphate synthase